MWLGSSSRRCSTRRPNGWRQQSESSCSRSPSGRMRRTEPAGGQQPNSLLASGSRRRVFGSRCGSLLRPGSILVSRSRTRMMAVRSSRIGAGRRRSESRISQQLPHPRKVGLQYRHCGPSEAVHNSHPHLWITRSNRLRKVGLWSGKVGLQYREGGTTVPPSPSETRRNQSFRATADSNLCTTGVIA